VALTRFAADNGGFYDTAEDAERLVARPADPTDNATPSGLSATAAALTAYAALRGAESYRSAAEAALATVAPMVARHARFTGYAAAVGESLLSGPYRSVIRCCARPTGTRLRARWWSPGSPTSPAYRCWPIARPPTGPPPPTCAVASSATDRSPPSRSWSLR
jgi:uncharacterized protein